MVNKIIIIYGEKHNESVKIAKNSWKKMKYYKKLNLQAQSRIPTWFTHCDIL